MFLLVIKMLLPRPVLRPPPRLAVPWAVREPVEGQQHFAKKAWVGTMGTPLRTPSRVPGTAAGKPRNWNLGYMLKCGQEDRWTPLQPIMIPLVVKFI